MTVGIDIGTTSVKGVAVDASGAIIARTRVPHPVRIPAPDRLEHDARRAWRAGPRRVLHQLAGSGPSAVAVSSMVPSLTAVDRRGIPQSPGLLYGDARGRTGGIDRRTDSDAGEVLGFLRWTAAECPGAAGYWSAPAVANYALGGVGAIDIGTAFTSTPLFGNDGWDATLSAACGVSVEQLPKVEMMGVPIGAVTGTSAVLAGGCVDGMCEQIVAGADGDGDVLVICGTTLITWVVTSQAVHAERLWTIPHTAPGMWATGGPSNAGGLFLGAVERMLGRPRRDERLEPHDIPVWSPYIRGERTPLHDPTRRAELHGVTLTHGPAAIRRAAWEASGFVVRHHLDLVGHPVRRLVATGGGTRVEGWMRALADCTGLPVHVAAVPEGAALGAAYLGRMALGLETALDAAAAWARTGAVVDPDPAWQAACQARYAVFRGLADRALP
ncbi:MAG: xylulokinase [Acidimicrobiales bacterium]